MKYSRRWLHHYLCPEASFSELIEKLKQEGLNVKLYPPMFFDFSGVVVGKIILIAPHPNADKLKLCKVNVGKDEILSIVCGANNIFPEMIVPVAVIGATLPDNFKIKKAKLRGEASSGMLCSSKELSLSQSSNGILSLPKETPIGASLFEYLQLNDEIIEVVDSKSSENLTLERLLNLFKKSEKMETKPIKVSQLKKLLKVLFKM